MKTNETILPLRRPGVICLALGVLLIAGNLDPRAAHAQPAMEVDTDRLGQDYKDFDLANPNPELCRSACTEDPRCQAFTYVKPGFQGTAARCYLKSGVPAPVANACCISGAKSAASARPPPAPQPPGSYRKSCVNVRVSGTTLGAECKDLGGTYLHTKLERIDLCRDDIRNEEGYLTCDKAGLPAGSYLRACFNINVSGGKISAVCDKASPKGLAIKGTPAGEPSHLSDYQLCLGDISNNQGFLDCQKSNAPGGTYLNSCVNVNVLDRVSRLGAACRKPNGSFQLTILEEFDRCLGDISNKNGFLTCEKAGQ